MQSLDYSCVVFDTAPTGHTLRLLQFPSTLDKALGKISSMKVQLCLEPPSCTMQALNRRVHWIAADFSVHSGARVVSPKWHSRWLLQGMLGGMLGQMAQLLGGPAGSADGIDGMMGKLDQLKV